MLQIKNLHASINEKEILRGVNLQLTKGKIHALMGPNGSGKSTLASIIMGHPKYTVTKGSIILNGEDITQLDATERARKGLFLSFQYPQEISGLTIQNFLRTAYNSIHPKVSILEFQKLLFAKLDLLGLPKEFVQRYLNEGFSGGEKKRCEILQMAVLNPHVAILDETDSGLDIDALKAVANSINSIMDKNRTILIITHYKRILEMVKPDELSILIDGKIALTGDGSLVDTLEQKGYSWIERE